MYIFSLDDNILRKQLGLSLLQTAVLKIISDFALNPTKAKRNYYDVVDIAHNSLDIPKTDIEEIIEFLLKTRYIRQDDKNNLYFTDFSYTSIETIVTDYNEKFAEKISKTIKKK